jgi:hypothetical protein
MSDQQYAKYLERQKIQEQKLKISPQDKNNNQMEEEEVSEETK